ncbi:RNA ligase family protein [Cellulomonas sp. SG140]|uniref:RNA ligase family protein n=1 Tax=Cellulomonas sp. SG140 TaxID=2976536 RepID=UPI0021E742B7|nr:RNA ligase family protein [Cellulomonas sp. SG140]
MSGGIVFTPWPKTPRLYREVTITEKIDGTNAAVGIRPLSDLIDLGDLVRAFGASEDGNVELEFEGAEYVLAVVGGAAVYAQSRKRLLTPTSAGDNYGFAAWVQRNAEHLTEILGPGLHFGEWWGSGIQRAYGLTAGDKRFSLFDTRKARNIDHAKEALGIEVPGLDVVPVLYEGLHSDRVVSTVLDTLTAFGSSAEPGFGRPEGVVVRHHASGERFKVLLEHDDQPKSLHVVAARAAA